MTQITKASLLVRVEALEKSLKHEVGERKRLEKALADSLEQQTATSEILRVISNSPTDLQPVQASTTCLVKPPLTSTRSSRGRNPPNFRSSNPRSSSW